MIRRFSKFAPAFTLFLLTIFIHACTFSPTLLTCSYAFRKAEHEVMTSPLVQSKITDVATQTKINALEGTYDIAWNCMFTAYEKASQGVPEGQPVNVDMNSFAPCAANAWAAAYQIVTTIRAFVPTFLSGSVTYTLPNGQQVTYNPTDFASALPPALPPVPPKGVLVGAK